MIWQDKTAGKFYGKYQNSHSEINEWREQQGITE
jgi:hypothetical protein